MSNTMNQPVGNSIDKRLNNRVGPSTETRDNERPMALPKSLANCPEIAKLSIKPEPIAEGHGAAAHVTYTRGQILTIGLLLADKLADPKTENQVWPAAKEVKTRLRSVGIYKNRLVAPSTAFAAKCAGDPGAHGCCNWRLRGDARFPN
ncbi:uncharacterized protein LOC117894927 [Drosophila subobscura]|uniref:uncharacterized protein LOC117894927 n=1 Tax=Drosophila subobscura TaxID=7241 RepID=UPI00155AFF20|nr:uncharacterized protein LOC117894927 [Drosophila subobscura]XP_034658132.1 uncharacterized protein LOC117894927 [Drosophila subobscura]